MNISRLISTALGGFFILGSLGGTQAAVRADTGSTAAIVAGAAGIVGALLYDGSNRPYYVRDNRRYYVSQNEAQYYRSHHHGVERRAFVPEAEYPVARNANGRGGGNMRGGNAHGGRR
jgi:hypothetical protein